MNDYGLFQAIENVIHGDGYLSGKITKIATAAKPDMGFPYVLVSFTGAQVDLVIAPQRVLVECHLKIISTYLGDHELQVISSRLDRLLQGQTHRIQTGTNNGRAIFKMVDVKREVDAKLLLQSLTLTYQINIILENQNE